jgi:hypothetical protein
MIFEAVLVVILALIDNARVLDNPAAMSAPGSEELVVAFLAVFLAVLEKYFLVGQKLPTLVAQVMGNVVVFAISFEIVTLDFLFAVIADDFLLGADIRRKCRSNDTDSKQDEKESIYSVGRHNQNPGSSLVFCHMILYYTVLSICRFYKIVPFYPWQGSFSAFVELSQLLRISAISAATYIINDKRLPIGIFLMSLTLQDRGGTLQL